MKIFYNIILTFAIALAIVPHAFAASPVVFEGDTTIAGVTYHLVYNRTGELSASVTTSNQYIVTANILSNIEREGKQYPVMTIGKNAFASRSRLTSVTIPNPIEAIENYAFRDCHKLDYISFPQSLKK